MSSKTGIEWTDSTWSPIRARVKLDATAIALKKGYTSLVQIAERMAGRVGQHCEHVSPGCEHCYAETNNHRCLPGNGTGLPYDRRSRDLVEVFVDEKVLLQPLKWKPIKDCRLEPDPANRAYIETERPRRIFVENQSDLFGEWVTDEMLDRVFAVMALCPGSIFQVLTKRPEQVLRYFEADYPHPGSARVLAVRLASAPLLSFARDKRMAYSFPLPNVWLGVSVENQKAADERVPLLQQTPAAVRFISAEPLLGPVMLDLPPIRFNERELDWVICGGESGPGARPMHPDWARSLRDQCAAAGVPFFFKQWGENWPNEQGNYSLSPEQEAGATDEDDYSRIGKKAAGALLDGREWKQFPEVQCNA